MTSTRGQSFYKPDSGYWVPFTTTVPKQDQYPAQEVTMYFMKSSAPQPLQMLTNVPDAYRKYSGFDLIFDKRFANGWQLGGSVTVSKTWGTCAGDYGNIWGYSAAGNDANWYRQPGRPAAGRGPATWSSSSSARSSCPTASSPRSTSTTIPELPGRGASTVFAPTAWANANGIDLQPQPLLLRQHRGAGHPAELHLPERRFPAGEGIRQDQVRNALSAYLDVYNLFGNYYVNVTQNPGGNWRPTDNNVATGTYAVSSNLQARHEHHQPLESVPVLGPLRVLSFGSVRPRGGGSVLLPAFFI